MKHKFYALIFLFPFFTNAYSQFTCGTATEIFPTQDATTIPGNLHSGSSYFKFKANATAIRLDLERTDVSILVRFYSSCDGSFIQAFRETPLTLGGLIVGNTYFYELYISDITATSSYKHTFKVFDQTANDSCGGATEVIPSLAYTGLAGNFSGATPSGARYEPMPDVWYKFKATSRAVQIQVELSDFDNATIEIYDSCGAKTPDTYSRLNSLFQGGLSIGKTYYYRFYGEKSPVKASYTTGVVALTNTPANDECEGAIEVIPQPTYTPISGNLDNATATWPAPGVDVWYKFKPVTNAVIIKMSSASTRENIFLYGGCIKNLIAEGKTIGAFKEIRLGGLLPNQTYFYKVSGYAPIVGAEFSHGVVTVANTAANDECTGAVEMTPTNVYTPIAGNFKNATPSLYTKISQYDSSGYDDVWYKFTATAKAMKITVVPTNVTVDLQLFSACGGTAYSPYYMSRDTATFLSGGYEVGQTYFYKIYAREAPISTSSFAHSVMPIETPPNDNCENAQAVTPSNNISWTTGTLKNATGEFGNSLGFDVWFKFIATSSEATIHQENCHYEPYLQAYADCNGKELTYVYSDELPLTNLIVGNTYYYILSNGMKRCTTSYEIKTAVVDKTVAGINKAEAFAPKIYPNPSRGVVTISPGRMGRIEVKLYDVAGQMVRDVSSNETILIEDLQEGLYFIQVAEGGNTHKVKLLVQ